MWDLAKVSFSVASFSIMPFWALMVLAPRWRVTARLVASPLIAAVPLVVYAGLVLPRLATLAPALARPELPVLAALLGTPVGAAIAWAHFLALDLLAGRWIFLDARARGLSPWLVSPLLVLTLLFAPLGLVAYAVARAVGSAAVAAPARALARRLWLAHRGLALVAAASLVVLALALAAQLVDGRQVLGASTWAKPAKFAASIAMAGAALAWIIGQLPGRGPRRAGNVIAAVAAAELATICVQAARGVSSHFNNATSLDAALFGAMGAAITVLWLCEVYVTVRSFRQTFSSAARTWGIRLGLVGSLLGGATGFLMPIPTPAQRAQLAAGERPALLGAHAVGVADGGPGLPVTRWSTVGGDLRVPHFLGLHALQALPLAAWLLERRRRAAVRPVVALGVAWLGITLVTLTQALRAQPLFAPDAVTLLGLSLVAATAALVALRPSRAPIPHRAPA